MAYRTPRPPPAPGAPTSTAKKWRCRFARDGLAALADAPRPGRPRTVSDALVEEVVTRALEAPPEGRTHWSRRAMARAVGVGQDSVGRIWRAFGLKPHLTGTFKMSSDPFFAEKVRDIIGLYLDPPRNALVLPVDAIEEYIEVHNRDPKPFTWTKTADEIFDKITDSFSCAN